MASQGTHRMQDFREYLSYGATGAIAFVLIRWVLPLFNAVISRAHVETSIYGNAKDLIDYTNEQLKDMQSRYSKLQERFNELETELSEERDRCRALQSRLEDALNAKCEN